MLNVYWIYSTRVFPASNRSHYKIREYVYAWLAYMDGVTTLDSVMNAQAWLESANYSIVMGADELSGSVAAGLKYRQTLLATGGHLLRSLEVTEIDSGTFAVVLDLEWKGVNQENNPVIARIQQILTIHIEADKTWRVMSIKEKHLLPNTAPWMGMLC